MAARADQQARAPLSSTPAGSPPPPADHSPVTSTGSHLAPQVSLKTASDGPNTEEKGRRLLPVHTAHNAAQLAPHPIKSPQHCTRWAWESGSGVTLKGSAASSQQHCSCGLLTEGGYQLPKVPGWVAAHVGPSPAQDGKPLPGHQAGSRAGGGGGTAGHHQEQALRPRTLCWAQGHTVSLTWLIHSLLQPTQGTAPSSEIHLHHLRILLRSC